MATTTFDLSVANTILEQLGGRRFLVMTGARDLVGGEDFLMFRLPSTAKDGSNKVRITLTPMDVYTVETFYVRGTTFRACSEMGDVYCDQLRRIFTSMTGLETSL